MQFHIVLFMLAMLTTALCKPASEESNERYSSKERDAIEQLKEHFEDACTRNSDSAVTYAEVMEAVAETTTCFGFKVDFGILLTEWRNLDKTNRAAFFEKYCPVIKNISTECLEPVGELSKLCLDPGAQRVEAPDFPLYLLPQVVDLMCEDSGAILLAGNSENPTECFGNYFSYIQRCMKNYVSETNAKSRQKYAEPECRVLEESRDCVLNKLSDCGNSKLIRFFDVPYTAIVKETECKNFLRIPEFS
ncbi:uncharacterized protein LOC5578211 [Aedes aegypti]|uniref:Uncharacterized protein n=1 Tax=Aedes aegypti TaxID=7159 RepID=A0A1S4F519_AEDAE|nr:uncharacterized protein LOC5578211 [Aedes aegypti]